MSNRVLQNSAYKSHEQLVNERPRDPLDKEVECKLATVTSYKADVSSVSPSSERMEELWVVCGFIWRKWSYAIGGNIVDEKNMNKLVE